ncbi:hypothetical protein CcrKarma_gp339 [Caulobacter virus Karma]|uniref:hypothetical protein n=1 Tax=Caulobacter virus Karma TaxID=1211641 RepID=UPI00028AC0F5|nr:hypothetical protein CcrKarma_gp006 [Caulobacter virus Karma]YP_006989719.1 hypothetical protein CcrKarma_gp339 [Caulobacter virus Karma]AFU87523.1 hypothetical protein CcrKarma_gp006 [Caulobacter virus Karma]AFU87856.1 hypothetical protein CcrKarma_gp339 [Caulobacter virus Karma]
MKVARDSFAVFWTLPQGGVQFHADIKRALYPTARDAARAFSAMFPRDRVRSVRDASGRFLAFKESAPCA